MIPKFRLKAAMYDIKWIREHPDTFDRGLKRRGLEPLSGKLLALDEKRRAAITKFEQAQARRNAASKEIGEAKKKKDEAAAQKLMAEVNELKVTLPALEQEQKKLGADLDRELAQIPNMPADDVPDGLDASGNVEHHVVGKKRDYAFKPKQHFELGEALGHDGFRTGGEIVRRALCGVAERARRAWNARSGNCSSTCIPATSTAIRRSVRRSWCATR